MPTFEFATESNADTQDRWGQRRRVVVVSLLCLILAFSVAYSELDDRMKLQQPFTEDTFEQDPNDSIENTSLATSDPFGSACECVCQTDRLGHLTPLFAGHALCNAQYRFGLTKDGDLVWQDCDLNETKHIHNDASSVSFQMTSNGTLQLLSTTQVVVWEKVPTLWIGYTKHCLSRPLLDCPYLHLHKSGDLVLNSISDGTWRDRKIQKCFDDLFYE